MAPSAVTRVDPGHDPDGQERDPAVPRREPEASPATQHPTLLAHGWPGPPGPMAGTRWVHAPTRTWTVQPSARGMPMTATDQAPGTAPSHRIRPAAIDVATRNQTGAADRLSIANRCQPRSVVQLPGSRRTSMPWTTRAALPTISRTAPTASDRVPAGREPDGDRRCAGQQRDQGDGRAAAGSDAGPGDGRGEVDEGRGDDDREEPEHVEPGMGRLEGGPLGRDRGPAGHHRGRERHADPRPGPGRRRRRRGPASSGARGPTEAGRTRQRRPAQGPGDRRARPGRPLRRSRRTRRSSRRGCRPRWTRWPRCGCGARPARPGPGPP